MSASFSSDCRGLFCPAYLGSLHLPNRIVVSPMCQYSAENGNATDWHMMHLGHLSLSGAALLFTEATAVEPAGRITPADLGLWSKKNEHALGKVVDAIRRYSPIRMGLQLSHAGRKASTQAPWEGGKQLLPKEGGWLCAAPSAVAYAAHDVAPQALDAAGRERIRRAFARAASRAAKLGFDTVELHAAHGYLLHQFLSPLSNQRTDSYGGCLENRMRFPLEVFEVVREAFSMNGPVGVRVSATDWIHGGWDLDQTILFAQALKAKGCDYIDVSSGGLSPAQHLPLRQGHQDKTGLSPAQQTSLRPGYQVAFAERIKSKTGLWTIAVGLITKPQQADDIIVQGKADMVSLARGMLYDPRWPWHAAVQLEQKHSVVVPKQYERAWPFAAGQPISTSQTTKRGTHNKD